MDEREKPIKVNVRVLNGETVEVEVLGGQDASVRQLQDAVQGATGVPVERQRLIMMGRVLRQDKNLSEYGIVDGSILHMVERQDGAASAAASSEATAPSTGITPVGNLQQVMQDTMAQVMAQADPDAPRTTTSQINLGTITSDNLTDIGGQIQNFISSLQQGNASIGGVVAVSGGPGMEPSVQTFVPSPPSNSQAVSSADANTASVPAATNDPEEDIMDFWTVPGISTRLGGAAGVELLNLHNSMTSALPGMLRMAVHPGLLENESQVHATAATLRRIASQANTLANLLSPDPRVLAACSRQGHQ